MLDSIKTLGLGIRQARIKEDILNAAQMALLERQEPAVRSFREFARKYKAQIHEMDRPINTDSALMDFCELIPKGTFTQAVANVHNSVTAQVKETLSHIKSADIDFTLSQFNLWDLIADDLIAFINEEYENK